MKKTLVLLGVLTLLAACNTVDGLGQDISSGARAIDRAI